MTSSFVGAALLVIEACTVPDVTFVADAADVTEDTGPADGQAAADWGAPTDADSGARTDADSGVTTDAGGGCPDAMPAGASYCCDSVPCHGAKKNCASSCSDCTTNCQGKTCCLKDGKYFSCAPDPASCP
jgi:hypothetical protein